MMILPKMLLSVKSFKDGKLYDGFDFRESHTWVRNTYNACFGLLAGVAAADSTFGDGYINRKSTSGTVGSALTRPIVTGVWTAPAGGVTSGIVVGTSATAWTFEDFKLGTLIAHGNGASQLSYTLGTVATDAWAGDVITITGTRTLNNNSGGTITIAEVALYNSSAMFTRDVLTSTVDVADTGQLVVTYQITGDCSP